MATLAVQPTTKLDFLQLHAEFGKRAGNLFYAVGGSGVLLLSICFVLLIYPHEDSVAKNNMQVLHLNNLWQLNTRANFLKQHSAKIALQALQHSDAHAHQTVLQLHEQSSNSATAMLLGLQQESDQGIPLSSAYFQGLIAIDSLQKAGKSPLNAQPSYQFIFTLSGEKYTTMQFHLTAHKDYSFSLLKELGLCAQELSDTQCAHVCTSNGGVPYIEKSSCDALYGLSEVCLAANFDTPQPLHSQIQGCYQNGAIFKYGAWGTRQNQQKASVQAFIRDVQDPVLKALQVSNSGLVPHRVRATKVQQVQKALLAVGASLVIIITTAMSWMRLSKKIKGEDDQYITEVSFDNTVTA